jgi:hypothetical protein
MAPMIDLQMLDTKRERKIPEKPSKNTLLSEMSLEQL